MTLVERRIGLLFAGFLLLLLVAGLRALQLGVLSGDRFSAAAASQQEAIVDVPARRGSIIDRHGVELAVAAPADDVHATPYLVDDPRAVAARLAPLLDRPEDELLRKLTARDTGFVYLARKVPGDRAEKVRELEIEGIDTTAGHKRSYPRDHLASQVLGVVGTEGKGLAGLELQLDEVLRGADGKRARRRDGVGDAVRIRDVEPARNGATVETTIDAAIQEKVEEVLAGVGETYRPKGASVVVMDPRSSEVLAMANWPRIDANTPSEAPSYASQNRAVGFTYEPGSTFKSMTVAGALQDGSVTAETSFDLPPQIQVADRTIGESHERGPVTLTTGGILAQSSNVGAIKVGLASGAEKFDGWVRRFGFGSPTGIALPGEEQGLLLALERYSGSSMGNLPIGQGLSVTPIQMAQAYAAVANGGILRTPRIVKRIGGKLTEQSKGRRIISRETSSTVRGMLEGVLAPGGTASDVQIPGYKLAGKTGTSNKVAETGGYSESAYVASFTGFAPASDPRLLISVMVDEPQGEIYGGVIAGPAFGKIASFALPYLEIPPG